jgi:hypothetical protein
MTDQTQDKDKCDHDISNPKLVSRAKWVCRKCGKDISLDYVLLKQAEIESKKP